MFAKFRAEWGPQAMWDAWAVKGIVSGMDHIVPHTLLPVLRLVSGDAEGVDRAYARVLARREPIARFDSPRERWRKSYGRFVRELEWVSVELKKHLPEDEYRALVSGTVARAIHGWIGFLGPKFAGLFKTPEGVDAQQPAWLSEISRKLEKQASAKLFRYFNVVSFMVGPLEVRSLDLARGTMEAYIPECWMHTVVGTGLPQQEACVAGCKGGTELAFGEHSPMRVELDPHLPGLACTLRASWDVSALRRGEGPKAPDIFVPEASLLKKARGARLSSTSLN